MSRQQLENKFTTLSVSTPTPVQRLGPRTAPRLAVRFPFCPTLRARSRPRRTSEPLPVELDELEKV